MEEAESEERNGTERKGQRELNSCSRVPSAQPAARTNRRDFDDDRPPLEIRCEPPL